MNSKIFFGLSGLKNGLYKLTVVLSAFLFALTPVFPVFANEEASGGSIVLESPVSVVENDLSQNLEPVPTNSNLESPAKNQKISKKVPVTEPPIEDSTKTIAETSFASNSATSGNTTSGNSNSSSAVLQKLSEIDQASGAYIYDYPISVIPGRNSLQPDLKISYNSQSKEDVNLLGYGLSLNIPYISRINKNGSEQLYTQKNFYSSLNGELVELGAGSFAAETENGEFLDYQLVDNAWIVQDKKGVTYKFGASVGARQDNVLNPTQVYKWMLEEVRDSNDNYIKYTYFKNDGQIYPAKIIYTGNGVVDGAFEVNFLLSSRVDNIKSYKTGFLVKSNFRISEINTAISGVWQRKYVLSYTTGDNGWRSMLSSITESGRDDLSNIVTLPATTFSYQVSTPGWTEQFIPWPTNMYINDRHQFLDLNSDSYIDLLFSFLENSNVDAKQGAHINATDNLNWVADPNLIPPILFQKREIRRTNLENVYDQGVRVVDVNGDQYPDIIQSMDRYLGSQELNAYINNKGGGWTQNLSWAPTLGFTEGPYPSSDFGTANEDYGTRVLDLNGDGLVDIARNYYGNNQQVQINTGTGFGAETANWNLPIEFRMPYSREVDINNDGLTDVLYHRWINNWQTHIRHTYLNTGTGAWASDTSLISPVDFTYFGDLGIRFMDLNGDGLVDVGVDPITPRNVHLNRGNSWGPENPSWKLPVSDNSLITGRTHLGDFNQDGLIDFVQTQGAFASVMLNTGVEPDLLSKITLSQGGFAEIAYQKSAKYKDATNKILNPKLPINLTTVKSISVNDGFGLVSTVNFSYEGGEYYFNGPFDRKFAGFSKIKKTESSGATTTIFFYQGNNSNISQGEFNDEKWKIGKVYRTELRNSSNNMMWQTINRWDSSTLGNGRKFVFLADSLSMTFDGDLSHRSTAESYVYNVANGNLLVKTEWGEVAGSENGSFVDIDLDKFITSNNYVSSANPKHAGFISQSITVDQVGNKVKESKVYYDGLTFGLIIKGNLSTREEWRGATNYINTQKTYDGVFGLVLSEVDPSGKITVFAYDNFNLYPTTITNALGHITRQIFDYSSGLVKQTTDANNRVFVTVFDGLDRLIEQKQPDLVNPTTLVVKTKMTYTDLAGSVIVKKSDYLDQANFVDSYDYYDGLGRKIQTRIEAEGVNYTVKDIIYNSRGLISKESLPYFSVGFHKTVPSTDPNMFINYSYDAVGRVITITNSVGITTNSFSDWKLTIIDPNGKAKDLYKNAYGNLIRVDEYNLGATYSTHYQYNYLKNLTKLVDALGNVRNFSYDALGRRLLAEDLHTASDTTFGVWNYTYDLSGNLTEAIDPKNQTIAYTYDDLNRILTEDYLAQAGVEVSYQYDVGTDGIGRLASVSNDAVVKSLLYNGIGLLNQETSTINNTNYVTSYEYDRQGNQILLTNPDGSQIKNIYNSAGLLEQVQHKEAGNSLFGNVASNFDYGPHGQVVVQNNSNNTITNNFYDASKMYRLVRKQTVGPGVAVGVPVTKTFYATSGDGHVTYSGSNSWGTTRNAIAGTSSNNIATTMKVHSGKINNTKFSMDRAFIAFDTAEIPDNVAISEVKLKVYVESKLNHDNDGDDWVTVVQGLQPSATSLAKADYDLAGSINFPEEGVDNSQRKDITNTAVNAFMEFSLNNTGRSWVSKTGVSKFAMREGHDVLDRPFVGSSGQYNQLVVRTGEFSGTTSDPILEVTYIDTPLAPTVIQDANYSYDNNGNILRIIEAQGTDSAKTTNYVYDDLNRLTHAVISGAVNGSNVGRSYTYDAIGNILSSSDQGVYTYAGSGLVNPHAVTRAGLVNYTYDNNGNLLSDGIWTHSWDYNNRIKQSAKTGLVVNYGYGVDGQRVRQTNGTTSTNYPTKLYNTEGGSAQKHIFANGSTIATVKGSNGSAVVYINHTDHLSGTSAMSNSTGALVQVLDYHPFGEMRLDWRFSSSFDEQRKFTGYELDRDTGLNYASARYYNAIIGRFISQDPVFLALGNSELVKSLTGSQLQSVLLDPQNLNAYAYARNNPIINTDPTGLFSLNPINLFSYNTQITIGSWANNAYTNNSLARYALDHPYQAGIAIGFVGGAAVSIGVMAGGGTITCGILCGGGATVTVATGGAALSTQANRAVGLLNNAQSTLLTAAQRQTVAGSIQNPTLRNIFNSLYQGNDKLPGGTAGAIRYEQATGNLLSPAGHLQKGQTTMNGLNKLLNNPNVSQGDKGLASMLRDQLSNAIKGK